MGGLREVGLAAGADEVAVVPLDHPAPAAERPFILKALPIAQALVCVVVRMAPAPVRSPALGGQGAPSHG